MKAAVVTFLRAYNYGAVLQCYALCKALKKVGIDAEAIDYYPEYFYNQYNLAYLGKLRYLPYRPFKNWFKYAPLLYVLRKYHNSFDGFIRKYIPRSNKQYKTYSELNSDLLNYDLYISGSDQVWSDWIAKFDPIFFLDFVSANGKKKYSYAASFGFSNIPEEKEREYKERLQGWEGYSVREKSGGDILKKMLGVNSTICCDPTMLLTKQEWDCVRNKKKQKEPYILVYSVNGYKGTYEYAQSLGKEKHMKVIFLPCIQRHEYMLGEVGKQYGFITKSHASPSEWLDLFANASYVCTDSFHGTVFSVMFKRPFMTHVQRTNKKRDGTSSVIVNNRAIELLTRLGLESRMIFEECTSNIDDNINWNFAEEQLQKIRDDSIKYLKSISNGE